MRDAERVVENGQRHDQGLFWSLIMALANPAAYG